MPIWLKRTLNITSTVLLVAFVLFVVLLVGVRLFGLEPHIVLSGSMEPEIKTGALVYLTDLTPEEKQNLQPGDTITYQVDAKGTKVTHKIHNVVGPIPIYDTDQNGNPKLDENGAPIIKSYVTDQSGETIVMYTTYGINNHGTLDGDPEKGNLASSNIVGKPVFSIPLLGYVANFLQTPSGRYMAISGCLLVVAFMLLSGVLGKGKSEATATADAPAEPKPEEKEAEEEKPEEQGK